MGASLETKSSEYGPVPIELVMASVKFQTGASTHKLERNRHSGYRPQFLPDRVPDLTKDIADVVCGLDTDGVLIGLAGIKSLLVIPLLVLGVVIIRLAYELKHILIPIGHQLSTLSKKKTVSMMRCYG